MKIDLWNTLRQDTVEAKSLIQFKKRLNHLMEQKSTRGQEV